MLNIEQIINNPNEKITLKALELLNLQFLGAQDDIEALEAMSNLAQLINSNMSLICLEIEVHTNFNEGEYDESLHIKTDINKYFSKLDYLKIKYPENKDISIIEKKLAEDFKYANENSISSKNKDFLNYKINLILNNNKVNSTINHKVLNNTEFLLQHVLDYIVNPKNINSLVECWNENSHFYTPNPMDTAKYKENNVYEKSSHYIGIGYPYKAHSKSFIQNNDVFVIEQIKIIQAVISEKLFTHFALFPEEQKKLSKETFPFFSLLDWSDNNKDWLKTKWTQDNIDVLSEYKNHTGYDYYIENLFKIDMNTLFADNKLESTQNKEYIPENIQDLAVFFNKKLNFDMLFENNTVGLPQTMQNYLDQLQSLKKEDIQKKLEDMNIFTTINKNLDYYCNVYKHTIKKLNYLYLKGKIENIPLQNQQETRKKKI